MANGLECMVRLGRTPLMIDKPYPDEYPLLGKLPRMPFPCLSVLDGNHRMYSRSRLWGILSFPCYIVPKAEILKSVEGENNRKTFAFHMDVDQITNDGYMNKEELYAFKKKRDLFVH